MFNIGDKVHLKRDLRQIASIVEEQQHEGFYVVWIESDGSTSLYKYGPFKADELIKIEDGEE